MSDPIVRREGADLVIVDRDAADFIEAVARNIAEAYAKNIVDSSNRVLDELVKEINRALSRRGPVSGTSRSISYVVRNENGDIEAIEKRTTVTAG